MNTFLKSIHFIYEKIERLKVVESSNIVSTSYRFVFINSGEGSIFLHKKEYSFREGDLLFIPVESVFQWRVKETSQIDYFSCSFQAVFVNEELGETESRKQWKHSLDKKDVVCSFVREVKQQIIELYTLEMDKKGNHYLLKQSKLLEMLHFYINYSCNKEQTNTLKAVEKTKKYMDEHYYERITTYSLAKMAELSPKYYSEIFKKEYNIGANDYLTSKRINKTKELLIRTSDSIRTIAATVGYADEFYFSRVFKKM